MTKKIPFLQNFDNAKKVDKWSSLFLWLSTLLIVAAFILQKVNIKFVDISDILNKVNCFFIIGYTVLEFFTEFILYNANILKRADFIDNSYNSNFSEEKSENYFTNDNIENGISKLGINSFENVLFSYNIGKTMLPQILIINIVFAFIFIALSILGYNNAVILIIQLTLPVILILKAIKLNMFVSRMKRVYDDYRSLFSILKETPNIKDKTAIILKNVLDYETTLSWANILLSSKIYNSLNKELSEKWSKMKNEYNIN